MLNKIKHYFRKKPQENINSTAKKNQLKHAGVLLLILVCAGAFYHLSVDEHKPLEKQEDTAFDGALDSTLNQSTDEALIEKQQHQIDDLGDALSRHEKTEETIFKAQAPDQDTKAVMMAIQDKLQHLEDENKAMREQLQVTLLQNSQIHTNNAMTPPTREEMAARLKQKQRADREIYARAGLETVHFQTRNRRAYL